MTEYVDATKSLFKTLDKVGDEANGKDADTIFDSIASLGRVGFTFATTQIDHLLPDSNITSKRLLDKAAISLVTFMLDRFQADGREAAAHGDMARMNKMAKMAEAVAVGVNKHDAFEHVSIAALTFGIGLGLALSELMTSSDK